jgi:hypothetical protein
MANPDYATLLPLIAAESDPAAKAILEAQCYVFNEELTEAERELFEFHAFDHTENNPGYVDGSYQSPGLYVLEGYVLEGYINTQSALEAGLYVTAGYVIDNYINTPNEQNVGNNPSGWTAYIGQYYSENGEVS